jgi:glycosyltransferase involved in cell wall biosynthesis
MAAGSGQSNDPGSGRARSHEVYHVMRILMLLDDVADLEGEVHYQDSRGHMQASARRDIQMLGPYLDKTRVQPEICTLRGGEHTLGARARLDVPAWRALLHLLRERDIELIHALGPYSTIYAALAGRVKGIPSVASSYFVRRVDERDILRRLLQRMQTRLIRSGINRVIVPSDLARRDFASTRFPVERIDVIYPGIEITDLFIPPPDRPSMGLPQGPLATMIAPVAPDQGYETLLDAVPRLIQRVPEANVAVLGAGPLLDAIRSQAESHGPPLPITWLDAGADMKAVIRASDVVIVHPRKEGVPHVLIEAAAAGKPVVASRMAGVIEIVEPTVTGFLVTPGDSRDFAIQIGRLLSQPASAEHIGLTAHRRAKQRFSLEAQRQALTILYETTIYESR